MAIRLKSKITMREAGRESHHGKEDNERKICTMKNRSFVLVMVLGDSWMGYNVNRKAQNGLTIM